MCGDRVTRGQAGDRDIAGERERTGGWWTTRAREWGGAHLNPAAATSVSI